MFTGIVEEIGKVESLSEVEGGWRLTAQAWTTLEGLDLGHSIAVNGACLTVTAREVDRFTAGLAPETLRRTNLGDLRHGDGVNLERPLAANGRIGGHFVQGHVDGVGEIRAFRPDGDSIWVTIGASPELMRYIVPKGYIAVDGVSLTVVDVFPDSFTFMLVAYTQQHITLPHKPVDSRVNLEVDILGKYAEKFIGEINYAPRRD